MIELLHGNVLFLQSSLPTVPANIWNLLFKPIPSVSRTCSSGTACAVPEEAIGMYLLLFIGIGALAYKTKEYLTFGDPVEGLDGIDDENHDNAGGSDETPSSQDDSSGSYDEPSGVTPDDADPLGDQLRDLDYDIPEEELDAIDMIQSNSIAPGGVERGFYSAVSGKKHRKVMFASGLPDVLSHNPLENLFTRPDLRYDMAIKFNPIDKKTAQQDLETRIDSLEAKAELMNAGGNQFGAGDRIEEAELLNHLRDAMKDGAQPWEMSMYIAARGDDEEDLEENAEKIEREVEDAPANITLTTLNGKQIMGLQSVAPTGVDAIQDETELDTSHVILGGGVGAFLASMSVSTELDPNGIEFGRNAFNNAPLIRSSFDSETNYNQVIIGESGSGKSVDVKMHSLREAQAREDVMLIFMDPLDGFHGLAHALDAKHITVGGDQGLNPLQINPVPEHIRDQLPEDYDALAKKEAEVMSFFDNYFELQGISIDQLRPTLQSAVSKTYERAGITHNMDTHSRDSPQISDLMDTLQHMAEESQEHIVRSEREASTIEENAAQLLNMLSPFEQGRYTNLNKESEFSLEGEDVVYVDLSQQESSSGGGTGLMMQLLFSLIYEQIKQTPRECIFVIDEAQYIMKEAKSLEFLSQRIRHARHFDTSVRFATQEVADFMSKEKSEAIINNSYITILHRTPNIEDYQEKLGLTDQQVSYVERAATGKHNNYSESLVQINEDWYPLRVKLTDEEMQVVDFEPGENEREELPGLREQLKTSPSAKAIYTELQQRAANYDSSVTPLNPPIPGDDLKNSWRTLSDENQQALKLLGWHELNEVLEEITSGTDPNVAVERAVKRKVEQVVSTVGGDGIQSMLTNGQPEASPSD